MSAAINTLRRANPLIALLVVPLLLPVPVHADTSILVASKTLKPGDARRVAIDFPVGELDVVGIDGTEISFKLEIRCERNRDCDDLAGDVRAITETRGDEVRIRIVEDSKWQHRDHHLRGRIEIPRSMAVEVEMKVGELEIEGLEKDLEVRMSVGEVDVKMPETAVRSVDVNVSIGDASMRPRSGGSSVRGWLGKHIDWDRGTGNSRLDIELSVGEATVRLM